jgi:hypothetical protein
VRRGGGLRRQTRRQDDLDACSLSIHLIRALQERRGDRQAKGLGGLEVDDQLELRRLLDGEIAGLGALENLVHVGPGVPIETSSGRRT